MREPGRHVFRAAGNGAGRAAPCHAPAPAVVAGWLLRMEGGAPGSFGLSANRRIRGGLCEFVDSRWGRCW